MDEIGGNGTKSNNNKALPHATMHTALGMRWLLSGYSVSCVSVFVLEYLQI